MKEFFSVFTRIIAVLAITVGVIGFVTSLATTDDAFRRNYDWSDNHGTVKHDIAGAPAHKL